MLNSGQVILRYRIAGLIGRGGTGVVYAAEELDTREPVAIKVLDWPWDDPQTRAQLRKEARATQALRHPNICEIKAIEQAGGLLCIVMERLYGNPLDELIAGRPLSLWTASTYGVDILSALDAAHTRAILHRDLKPSKIVICEAGAKVLNLGFGWILKRARGDAVTAAFDLNTVLSYVSPEHMSRPKDARSDLFSFGCILYEMATGSPPFHGDRLQAVVEKILNHAPTAPRELNPDIPAGLEQIILRALEKDPDARYQNAAAMRAELEEVRRQTEATITRPAAPRPTSQPPADPLPASQLTPATIGRYQVVRAIGSGGMGTVYLARDPNVGNREVAIKVVSAEQLENLGVHELFEREVHAASLLRHQNIVAVFDAGVDNGRAFIVMEYVEGETLLDLIRSNAPLSLGRKLELMDDVCAGLEYAHRRGIVHRDIAPSNLIVDANGVLKILDFGIANVGAANDPDGTIVGKAGYMAPEQIQGKNADPRADMFAAGVVFYELLTNRSAFTGDTVAETLRKRLSERPVPLESILPSLDPEIVWLVDRCLESRPEHRYPDMSTVRQELAKIRRRLGTDEAAGEAVAVGPLPIPDAAPRDIPTASVGASRDVPAPATARAGLVRGPDDTPSEVYSAIESAPAAYDTPLPTASVGAGLRRPMFLASADDAEVLPRTVDLALPAHVPARVPMELIALVRLPESPSLQMLLDLEGEADSNVRTRSRGFGMEFVRDATGRLAPATVTMCVIAPDFDPPRIEKVVRVRPDRDCERQSFLLTPKQIGQLQIQVDILLHGVTLASRSLSTEALQWWISTDRKPRPMPPGPPVVVSVPLQVDVVKRPWTQRFRPVAAMLALAASAVIVAMPSADRDQQPPGIAGTEQRSLVPARSDILLPGSQQDSAPPLVDSSPGETIVDGPSHALIIGINSYSELPPLRTAVADAMAMEQVLREQYGFQTKVLTDVTRLQLLTAINDYRPTLSEDANLLIYYAGHGNYDKDADKAYWLPIDAQKDNSATWIIADDITANIRAIPARKILVVADSCYSGGLTRGAFDALITPQERGRYLEKARAGLSRILLSSGGNEPVADGGGDGNHSVFASALLRGLNNMQADRFTALELFAQYIQKTVAGRSEQMPQYMVIRNSGHEDGDFVFVRQPAMAAPGTR